MLTSVNSDVAVRHISCARVPTAGGGGHRRPGPKRAAEQLGRRVPHAQSVSPCIWNPYECQPMTVQNDSTAPSCTKRLDFSRPPSHKQLAFSVQAPDLRSSCLQTHHTWGGRRGGKVRRAALPGGATGGGLRRGLEVAAGGPEGAKEASWMHCPARRPPFWAVKRPARPYKSAIQTRVTVGNAKVA